METYPRFFWGDVTATLVPNRTFFIFSVRLPRPSPSSSSPSSSSSSSLTCRCFSDPDQRTWTTGVATRNTPRISRRKSSGQASTVDGKGKAQEKAVVAEGMSVGSLRQNGDPLGRKDLGKGVVRWISLGTRALASDVDGESSEELSLMQRLGPGLTFVIHAQPYLIAIPMPLGMEAICLKACTHYPTLFDHFRDVLQDLQRRSLIQDWRRTKSWKLLKDLACSSYVLSFPFLSFPHSYYFLFLDRLPTASHTISSYPIQSHYSLSVSRYVTR